MNGASKRRVVITGIGVISPLGNSVESLWNALASGTSGVRPLASVPRERVPVDGAGECWDFTTGDIGAFGPLDKAKQRNIKKNLKVACREIQMGVAVAQLAMHQAGLAEGVYDPDRTGVVYGSDYMMTVPEEFNDSVRECLDAEGQFDFERWGEAGIKKVDPLWLLKFLPNMPASHIAIYNDMRGPNNSITIREASANLALAEAACTIERGHADIIIAGSTGTRVHPLRTLHMALQEQLATGDDPAKLSRPFDKNRNGLVIGEGAAALVLEELSSAQRRGVKIYGEIVGFGSSSVVANKTVARCGQALANSMRMALRTSGKGPDDIGHVHAHGLGTPKCDAEEAQAINDVFRERSTPVPVTAAKSYFGNLGAGAGAIELIASLEAIARGQLFPVLNYETPDPQCDIAVARSLDTPPGTSVLSGNVTPQGQASAILAQAFVE
ncbi:MAG: beta-ketoacyl-[acyl-carrier-protein] synthase family protein [Planctomycetales bacterium]|nr:beta-ketoacyl-[acyl-carrier-protein] synthase family protein [Planctomycetales bacterium]